MSDHWEKVRIGEVTTKVGSGSTPRGGAESYCATGIPLIRSMNVHFDGLRREGLAFIDANQAKALDGVTVEANDVLLNITGASIGRVTQAPPDLAGARVNQHVCIIRTTEVVTPAYLQYFLATPAQQDWIVAEEAGATRQALTKEKILGIEIPLPPLPEQRRIVSKIESLTARSRRAKEALDAIPTLLEQFRQSVLAAAFRGDLTAGWRAKNPDVEPAEVLLKRIRVERRKRWEEAELAKMVAKGKTPGDDRWKAKYEEPAAVDTSELPELPEGWGWASVCELGEVLTGGTPPGKTDGCYGGTTPFYKPSDLDGGIRMDAAREYLTELGETFVHVLPPMSVLITCIGATIGKTGLARKRCATNQQINAIVPEAGVESIFLYWVCVSYWAQDWIRTNASATTLPILNKGRFERMPMPIAPTEEQKQICSLLSKIEGRIVAFVENYELAEVSRQSLDRSILSKAFRGELVPQDPADEPASVLLQRIRGEVTEQGAAKPKRGRGAKTTQTSMKLGDE